MKDNHKNNLINKNILNDMIKRRERKAKFQYYTPDIIHKAKTPFGKNIRNTSNTKLFSKIDLRPIDRNSRNAKNQILLNNDNGLSKININRIISFDNSYNYPINNKKMVFFAEPSKKLSDYILKNKPKKKIYQLIYLDENDLNCLRSDDETYNNTYNNNYYSNREYNPKLLSKQKKIYNFDGHDNNNYLIKKLCKYNNYSYNNDIYNDRIFNDKSYNDKSYNENNRRHNYSCYIGNDIYSHNQKNDQKKVVKIQAMWRGHLTRKWAFIILQNYYNMIKIINCLQKILYNNLKSKFKQFFNIISQKKKNIGVYANNKRIVRNKKIIPNTGSCICFRHRKKNNNNGYRNENIKKMNVIDNKNINFSIIAEKKDEKKVYAPPKNNLVIYRCKNNIIKKSPILTKKSFDIKRRDNNILKGKTKGLEVYTKLNYKNKNNLGINKIVKYIIRKIYLLYFPLLLYRLKILQKVNLIVFKYKCLLKAFKIKEKLGLYHYFHKYRKNILSQTVNLIFIENKDKFQKKHSFINNNKKDNDLANNNLADNNLVQSNNNTNKKNELLRKIIIKKDLTIKIFLLKKYLNRWKKKIKKILDLQKRNRGFDKNYINKSTEIPRKKFIKIKRVKSNNITNDITQSKIIGNKKGLVNSFDIDNFKRMKVSKLKLDSGLSKEFINNNNNNNNNDKDGNSIFIQKIASVFRKIGDKDMKYQYFNYWKKKSKENK